MPLLPQLEPPQQQLVSTLRSNSNSKGAREDLWVEASLLVSRVTCEIM